MGEIEKMLANSGASTNYRLVNLGGGQLYIEGIKTVVGFDQNKMQFQLKKQMLTVEGSQLKIKYLDKTTCVIIGEIVSMVVQ